MRQTLMQGMVSGVLLLLQTLPAHSLEEFPATDTRPRGTIQCEQVGAIADDESDSCATYYICAVNSDNVLSPVFAQCPGTTVFSRELRRCVDAATYACESAASRMATREVGFQCTEDGRFPNVASTDCKSYFLCTKNTDGSLIAALVTCPASTIFSEEKKSCVSSPPNICPHASSTTTFEPELSSTLGAPEDTFECPSQGRFVNEQSPDCSTYYMCIIINDKLMPQLTGCPGGYVFSVIELNCVTEDLYTCPKFTVPSVTPPSLTSTTITMVTTTTTPATTRIPLPTPSTTVSPEVTTRIPLPTPSTTVTSAVTTNIPLTPSSTSAMTTTEAETTTTEKTTDTSESTTEVSETTEVTTSVPLIPPTTSSITTTEAETTTTEKTTDTSESTTEVSETTEVTTSVPLIPPTTSSITTTEAETTTTEKTTDTSESTTEVSETTEVTTSVPLIPPTTSSITTTEAETTTTEMTTDTSESTTEVSETTEVTTSVPLIPPTTSSITTTEAETTTAEMTTDTSESTSEVPSSTTVLTSTEEPETLPPIKLTTSTRPTPTTVISLEPTTSTGSETDGFPTPGTFQCPAEGRYPDPNGSQNCESYILCIKNSIGTLTPIQFLCPPTTIFSPTHGLCVSALSYSCRYETSSIVPPTTVSPTVTTTVVPTPTPFVCPATGRYPNPDSLYCKSYYLCLYDGKLNLIGVELSCPGGSIFDNDKLRCVPSGEYQCVQGTATTGVTTTTTPAATTTTTTSATTISMAGTCTMAGIFPTNTANDCSSYQFCGALQTGGLVEVILKCQGNTLFDEQNKVCSDKYVCPRGN
ncbi:mucin-2-like [Anopheles marshallii]|uniref:mucin-2-like n=1 Tax=Anopheles marshallii TaxID=1521116 RepID=UPI00237A964E|nr:mucin-2-like [Anopheles marshallii]